MAAHVRTMVIPEADRGDLGVPLRRRGPGRVGRPPAAGQAVTAARRAARRAAGPGAGADADPAAHPVRRDALVLAAAGRGAGGGRNADLARHHRPDLARLRRAALAGTFKFSTDPALEAKIRDVVGLYLHPPEKAVVLCVDEKPQIQ